ncbi:MAG: hypothetical protein EOM68_08770 [Spirochaetia bacterium]|nr:hypothetical protein [Spirochaetia bacterium]
MKALSSVKEIWVSLDFGHSKIPVGRLALREHKTYFAYDSSFIDRELEISPFTHPSKAGLTSFDNTLFEGLPGLFNDCLPNGWGRLLFDRFAQSQGVVPSEITPLDRRGLCRKEWNGCLGM